MNRSLLLKPDGSYRKKVCSVGLRGLFGWSWVYGKVFHLMNSESKSSLLTNYGKATGIPAIIRRCEVI